MSRSDLGFSEEDLIEGERQALAGEHKPLDDAIAELRDREEFRRLQEWALKGYKKHLDRRRKKA